jgi:hypothetical protein
MVAQAESQRRRSAAGLHLESGHPPATSGCRRVVPVANDSGEGVQNTRLLRRRPDDVRGGDAFGQLEIGVRSRVADHHFAQKLTEPIAPAGLRQRLDLAVLTADLRRGL